MPSGFDEFNFENFFRSGTLTTSGGGFSESFGTRRSNPGITAGLGNLVDQSPLSRILADEDPNEEDLGFLELQRRFNAIITPSLAPGRIGPLERLLSGGF